MRARLIGLALAMVMAASTLVAAAGPSPAATSHPRWHGKAYMTYAVKHYHVGPSRWTDGGVYRFTGFKRCTTIGCGVGPTGWRVYTPRYTVTNPTKLLAKIDPKSWWNPGSWHWLQILGRHLLDTLEQCISGALDGVMPSILGSTGARILSRGRAVLDITPQGLAVVALGGCLWNLVKS